MVDGLGKVSKITDSGTENVNCAMPTELSVKYLTFTAFNGEEFTKRVR